MALTCAIHFPAHATDDAGAIRAIIGATWDKPDSKVEIDPVVISGAYAVASWSQGAHGGRALMRRGDNGRSVMLYSDDPLKDAGWLAEAGVPQDDALRIAKDFAAAEALIPGDRRTRFSLFEGVVSGAGDDHSAAGHDAHPHK